MICDREINRLEETIKSEGDIVRELLSFKWKSDKLGGLIDWSPNIYDLILSGKQDDCDGAAEYTRFLFSIIKIPVTVVSLFSKNPFLVDSHVAAIANDNGRYMLYSNGYKHYGYKDSFNSIEEAIDSYNAKNKYYNFYNLINY
jgi:hypothetical protein